MTLSNRNFDRLPDCEGTQPWSDKTMSKYYYNCVSKTPLSEDEGASFAEWMEDPNHPCRFARHPEGFLVFLRPAEILTLDEYSEGDPYAVAENLDKPFHKLRVDMTIDLLAQVIGGEPGLSILDVACGEGHITAAIHRAAAAPGATRAAMVARHRSKCIPSTGHRHAGRTAVGLGRVHCCGHA